MSLNFCCRAWCPDRTITQSRKYVASSLGQKFAEPVILNMEVLYNESRALTPMICFLSIGSDPSPYIEQLAKRLEFRVKSISMGQGQEVHARKMMTQAMTEVRDYDWVGFRRRYSAVFSGFLGSAPELSSVAGLHAGGAGPVFGFGKGHRHRPSRF